MSGVYLALGDSMSIDFYTGVAGGGAVSQFHRQLGPAWSLDDRTVDDCRMRGVPIDAAGDLITLTIGGNDLLMDQDRYLSEGLASFAEEHLQLLRKIRARNPQACFIVGNVYAPQAPLPPEAAEGLLQANAAIAFSAAKVDARLADIHAAFLGHEIQYLCQIIEPTLAGATVIAELFAQAARQAGIGLIA